MAGDLLDNKEYALEVIDRLKVCAQLLALREDPHSVFLALELPPTGALPATRAMHKIFEMHKNGMVISDSVSTSLLTDGTKVMAYEFLLHIMASEHVTHIEPEEHDFFISYSLITVGEEPLLDIDIPTLRRIGNMLELGEQVRVSLWEKLE